MLKRFDFDLTVLLVFIFVGIVFAASRQSPFVTKMSQNDGDTISGVSISCSSTTWTTLLAASPTRRVAKLNSVSGATTVILTTYGRSVYHIGVSTEPGYWLAGGGTYEHASESAVVCRSTDNAASATIYGLEYTDSGDNTSLP